MEEGLDAESGFLVLIEYVHIFTVLLKENLSPCVN